MSVRKIDPLENTAIPEGEAPSHEYRAMRLTPDSSVSATRVLANEVPVAMEFDGTPYAVMMLTPDDLEDFAVGFALAERIVSRPSDIARIDVRHGADRKSTRLNSSH